MATRIYLMGFMGSGKSYLLNDLAGALGLKAYDLDTYIEAKEQRSISEIFAKEGEASFRQKESQYLKEFGSQDNFVLALGGGTPCSKEHISWLKQSGLTVFLDVSEALLWQRLKNNQSQRPLIAQLSDKELRAFIHTKLAQRRAFYAQAHLRITEDMDAVSVIKPYLDTFFTSL